MLFNTPRTHLKGHNFPIRIPFFSSFFSWLQNHMENLLQGEFCENKSLEINNKIYVPKITGQGHFNALLATF